jgi:hypothetical protein
LKIITLNDLLTAIEKKLDIDKVKAKKYANIVMDFFGFEDRIIDNALDQNDRQLFYMLETQGLLHTQREMIILSNGQQWRIHYWLLSKKTILKSSKNHWINNQNKNRQLSHHDNIYLYLPKDMWMNRKKTAI